MVSLNVKYNLKTLKLLIRGAFKIAENGQTIKKETGQCTRVFCEL